MTGKTMKAIKVVSNSKAEVRDVPIPALRDNTVLVKINVVAANPIDWMDLDWMPVADCTLGCDFAGTVSAVGPLVTKSWKEGDRVLGWVLGNNTVQKDEGAFAEYCVANADVLVKIPDSMSDEEAASPPAGFATAGMGLFQKHGLPLPGEGDGRGEQFLIYGGTTATATLAIQLAKIAGYDPITTCSARAFDHVKSLGASAAFDYKDPEVGQKIKEHTKDQLTKVLDCVSKDASPKICADAISSKGGVISHTLPYPEDLGRKDIETKLIFTLGMWGINFGYGEQVILGNPEDWTFTKRNYAVAEKLLHDGKLKVHPPKAMSGGLEGVLDGLQELKSGKASGVKLVYKL